MSVPAVYLKNQSGRMIRYLGDDKWGEDDAKCCVISGAQEGTDLLHPTMASFRTIAERNQAKARRRYLRARRLTPHGRRRGGLGWRLIPE